MPPHGCCKGLCILEDVQYLRIHCKFSYNVNRYTWPFDCIGRTGSEIYYGLRNSIEEGFLDRHGNQEKKQRHRRGGGY